MNKGLIFLLIIILVGCLLAQEDKDYPVLPLPMPKTPPPPPKRKTYLRKQGQTIIHPNGSSTTTYLINHQGWSESEDDEPTQPPKTIFPKSKAKIERIKKDK